MFVKLYVCGIRGKFLSWILNFFSDLIHQTKVNSLLSEPENLLSGVIQGSGIGLIMFVMFINDLIDALEQFGVSVKLFADDVKVYHRQRISAACCTAHAKINRKIKKSTPCRIVTHEDFSFHT